MGREVKRVAMDFEHPFWSEWPGYINPDYVECPVCGGDDEACTAGVWNEYSMTCIHADHAAAYAAWEPVEPPAGEGYQLWETVSNGSPVSPVFASSEALADWMQQNGYANWAVETIRSGGTWMPSGWVFIPDEKDVFDVIADSSQATQDTEG